MTHSNSLMSLLDDDMADYESLHSELEKQSIQFVFKGGEETQEGKKPLILSHVSLPQNLYAVPIVTHKATQKQEKPYKNIEVQVSHPFTMKEPLRIHPKDGYYDDHIMIRFIDLIKGIRTHILEYPQHSTRFRVAWYSLSISSQDTIMQERTADSPHNFLLVEKLLLDLFSALLEEIKEYEKSPFNSNHVYPIYHATLIMYKCFLEILRLDLDLTIPSRVLNTARNKIRVLQVKLMHFRSASEKGEHISYGTDDDNQSSAGFDEMSLMSAREALEYQKNDGGRQKQQIESTTQREGKNPSSYKDVWADGDALIEFWQKLILASDFVNLDHALISGVKSRKALDVILFTLLPDNGHQRSLLETAFLRSATPEGARTFKLVLRYLPLATISASPDLFHRWMSTAVANYNYRAVIALEEKIQMEVLDIFSNYKKMGLNLLHLTRDTRREIHEKRCLPPAVALVELIRSFYLSLLQCRQKLFGERNSATGRTWLHHAASMPFSPELYQFVCLVRQTLLSDPLKELFPELFHHVSPVHDDGMKFPEVPLVRQKKKVSDGPHYPFGFGNLSYAAMSHGIHSLATKTFQTNAQVFAFENCENSSFLELLHHSKVDDPNALRVERMLRHYQAVTTTNMFYTDEEIQWRARNEAVSQYASIKEKASRTVRGIELNRLRHDKIQWFVLRDVLASIPNSVRVELSNRFAMTAEALVTSLFCSADHIGVTPLHLATQKENIKLCEMLCRMGASPFQRVWWASPPPSAAVSPRDGKDSGTPSNEKGVGMGETTGGIELPLRLSRMDFVEELAVDSSRASSLPSPITYVMRESGGLHGPLQMENPFIIVPKIAPVTPRQPECMSAPPLPTVLLPQPLSITPSIRAILDNLQRENLLPESLYSYTDTALSIYCECSKCAYHQCALNMTSNFYLQSLLVRFYLDPTLSTLVYPSPVDPVTLANYLKTNVPNSECRNSVMGPAVNVYESPLSERFFFPEVSLSHLTTEGRFKYCFKKRVLCNYYIVPDIFMRMIDFIREMLMGRRRTASQESIAAYSLGTLLHLSVLATAQNNYHRLSHPTLPLELCIQQFGAMLTGKVQCIRNPRHSVFHLVAKEGNVETLVFLLLHERRRLSYEHILSIMHDVFELPVEATKSIVNTTTHHVTTSGHSPLHVAAANNAINAIWMLFQDFQITNNIQSILSTIIPRRKLIYRFHSRIRTILKVRESDYAHVPPQSIVTPPKFSKIPGQRQYYEAEVCWSGGKQNVTQDLLKGKLRSNSQNEWWESWISQFRQRIHSDVERFINTTVDYMARAFVEVLRKKYLEWLPKSRCKVRNRYADYGEVSYIDLKTLIRFCNESNELFIYMPSTQMYKHFASFFFDGRQIFNMKGGLNCDLELCDRSLRTPLLLAGEHDASNAVKLFLQLGAGISAVDGNKDNILSMAIRKGNVDVLKSLLEYDSDQEILFRLKTLRSISFFRPYVNKIESGRLEKYLKGDVKDLNADINLLELISPKDRVQWNLESIWNLSRRGSGEDIRRFLYKKGDFTLVNSLTPWGFSPVYYACLHGNLEALRLLLSMGGVVEIVEEDNKVETSSKEFLSESFISHLKRAMQFDQMSFFSEESYTSSRIPSIKYGVHNKMTIPVKPSIFFMHCPSEGYRDQALHACVEGDHLHCMQLLVESAGATVDCLGNKGDTPLMRAFRTRNMYIAQYLLLRGASKTIVNRDGDSVLSLCLETNDLMWMRMLFSHCTMAERTQLLRSIVLTVTEEMQARADRGESVEESEESEESLSHTSAEPLPVAEANALLGTGSRQMSNPSYYSLAMHQMDYEKGTRSNERRGQYYVSMMQKAQLNEREIHITADSIMSLMRHEKSLGISRSRKIFDAVHGLSTQNLQYVYYEMTILDLFREGNLKNAMELPYNKPGTDLPTEGNYQARRLMMPVEARRDVNEMYQSRVEKTIQESAVVLKKDVDNGNGLINPSFGAIAPVKDNSSSNPINIIVQNSGQEGVTSNIIVQLNYVNGGVGEIGIRTFSSPSSEKILEDKVETLVSEKSRSRGRMTGRNDVEEKIRPVEGLAIQENAADHSLELQQRLTQTTHAITSSGVPPIVSPDQSVNHSSSHRAPASTYRSFDAPRPKAGNFNYVIDSRGKRVTSSGDMIESQESRTLESPRGFTSQFSERDLTRNVTQQSGTTAEKFHSYSVSPSPKVHRRESAPSVFPVEAGTHSPTTRFTNSVEKKAQYCSTSSQTMPSVNELASHVVPLSSAHKALENTPPLVNAAMRAAQTISLYDVQPMTAPFDAIHSPQDQLLQDGVDRSLIMGQNAHIAVKGISPLQPPHRSKSSAPSLLTSSENNALQRESDQYILSKAQGLYGKIGHLGLENIDGEERSAKQPNVHGRIHPLPFGNQPVLTLGSANAAYMTHDSSSPSTSPVVSPTGTFNSSLLRDHRLQEPTESTNKHASSISDRKLQSGNHSPTSNGVVFIPVPVKEDSDLMKAYAFLNQTGLTSLPPSIVPTPPPLPPTSDASLTPKAVNGPNYILPSEIVPPSSTVSSLPISAPNNPYSYIPASIPASTGTIRGHEMHSLNRSASAYDLSHLNGQTIPQVLPVTPFGGAGTSHGTNEFPMPNIVPSQVQISSQGIQGIPSANGLGLVQGAGQMQFPVPLQLPVSTQGSGSMHGTGSIHGVRPMQIPGQSSMQYPLIALPHLPGHSSASQYSYLMNMVSPPSTPTSNTFHQYLSDGQSMPSHTSTGRSPETTMSSTTLHNLLQTGEQNNAFHPSSYGTRMPGEGVQSYPSMHDTVPNSLIPSQPHIAESTRALASLIQRAPFYAASLFNLPIQISPASSFSMPNNDRERSPPVLFSPHELHSPNNTRTTNQEASRHFLPMPSMEDYVVHVEKKPSSSSADRPQLSEEALSISNEQGKRDKADDNAMEELRVDDVQSDFGLSGPEEQQRNFVGGRYSI